MSEATGEPADPTPPVEAQIIGTSFREAQWRWSDLIIGLVPAPSLSISNHLAPNFKENIPGWLSGLISLSGQLWLLLYPLVMVRRRGAYPRAPKLREVAFEAIFTVPTLMSIWIVLMAAVSIWVLVVGEPATPNNPIEGMVQSLNPWVILTLGLLAVCWVPISEEIFFRGMIYNKLRTVLPVWSAIIVQGLLFGFVHTFGLTHALLASILGMGLGVIYELRKKLAASMLVHALQNFTALSLTVLLTILLAHSAKLGVATTQHKQGLLIEAVEPNSPAAEAGLQPGDILTAMDDVAVRTLHDLRLRLLTKGGGDTIKLSYLRNGQQQSTNAKLQGEPAFLPEFKLPGQQPVPPVVPAR